MNIGSHSAEIKPMVINAGFGPNDLIVTLFPSSVTQGKPRLFIRTFKATKVSKIRQVPIYVANGLINAIALLKASTKEVSRKKPMKTHWRYVLMAV